MTRLQQLGDSGGGHRELDLSRPRVVLGRGPDADWSFDDAAVSRRHAAVHHAPGRDEIEDLGSRAGTLVNGSPLRGRRTLRAGDVVELASVRLRYLADDPRDDGATTSMPRSTAPVTFDVDEQHGGVISNVGRDQYNQYVQQVIVSREDAFRQIASMSRVARTLLIVGFSLAVSGVLGFIASIMLEATKTTDTSSPEAFQETTQPFELLGIPVFVLAMGVALVGMGLTFLGVIIQFAASTRKRDVDRRYPLPPGWGGQ
jgi:FHA domain